MLDTKKDLCVSCLYHFPECPSIFETTKFGDGVGNDNIIICATYKQSYNSPNRPIDNNRDIKLECE